MNTDSDFADRRSCISSTVRGPTSPGTTRLLRMGLHLTGTAPSVPSRPSAKKVWSDRHLAQYADLNRRRRRCFAMPGLRRLAPRLRLGGRRGRAAKRNVLLDGLRPVRPSSRQHRQALEHAQLHVRGLLAPRVEGADQHVVALGLQVDRQAQVDLLAKR